MLMERRTAEHIFIVHLVTKGKWGVDGVWLALPADEKERGAVIEKIGLPAGAEPGQYFIDEYKSSIPGLDDDQFSQNSLGELDGVAHIIASLPKDDRKLLNAVQESSYRLTTLEQLREFPSNTEFFVLEPQVKTVEDLGWRYLDQHLDISLSPELRAAIDPVPFGKAAMKEDKGFFTKHGYLSLSGDEWRMNL